MVEASHHRGIHVTVVVRNPHSLPLLDPDLAGYLQKQIRAEDFDFKVDATAFAFTPEGVVFSDGSRWPPVGAAFGRFLRSMTLRMDEADIKTSPKH